MANPLSAEAAIARFDESLRAIEKDTEKELLKEMRRVGDEARDAVRRSTEPPYRTGTLRKSIRTSVRRKSEISLYSTLPQAPVWEFGGKIAPKGAAIDIPQTNFVRGTVLAIGDDIDDRLADAFDEISHRHGWI